MWASAPTKRKSEPGSGGHTGRPYGELRRVLVGADCISALAHFQFAAGLRRIAVALWADMQSAPTNEPAAGCSAPGSGRADVGIGPY